jgi:hypothetical protein
MAIIEYEYAGRADGEEGIVDGGRFRRPAARRPASRLASFIQVSGSSGTASPG